MSVTYLLGHARHWFLISTVTFIMALLVAQTRVEAGVHSLFEVFLGGMLGTRDARGLSGVLVVIDEELLARADAIAAQAYAPYSNFNVGAAILTRDGRVQGSTSRMRRIRWACAPSGPCSSRAATEGLRPGDIEAIAINASPCGCRQWLHEWRVERVTFRNANGEVVTQTVSCCRSRSTCEERLRGRSRTPGRRQVGNS